MSDGSKTAVTTERVIPSHGRGQLMPPWQKGQRGNPSGKLGEYHIVRRMCADMSVRATERLFELMEHEDARVATVAVKEILDRGVGRPRDHSDEQTQRVDTSVLSQEKREALAALLREAMGL